MVKQPGVCSGVCAFLDRMDLEEPNGKSESRRIIDIWVNVQEVGGGMGVPSTG